MEYEYVALIWAGADEQRDAVFVAKKQRFLDQGWQTDVVALIEIHEIAKGTKGSVLNERAMQADLIGRLEDRNAELRGRLDNQKEAMRMQNRRIEGLQIELILAKGETNDA